MMQVNSQQDNSKLNVKLLIGSVGGTIGVGVFGIALKLIYDKIHNNEVKLDSNIEKYISKNFFLSKWERNSCWNDVFIQFLMCPDIRCKKFESEKINAIIKIINDFLNKKYDGNILNRSKLFKSNERPIPDGLESWLTDGKEHYSLVCYEDYKYDKLSLIDLRIFDQMGRFNALSFKEESFLPETTGKKINNYLFTFINDDKSHINKIFSPKSKDYYPTFIVIFDNVHYSSQLPHYFACYIIYDKNKEAKYFLLANGLKDSMKILSKEQGLNELKQYCCFDVKYSSEKIINEFYTLED